MTATCKVYSVTSFAVLFEKEAAIWMTESLLGGLEILNEIDTWLPWIPMSLTGGRPAPSSGKAELKFHSSSPGAPLFCCGIWFCWLGGSNPNSDGGGVEAGWDRKALSDGEGCAGGEDKEANGSAGFDGCTDCCEGKVGPGVVARDEVSELEIAENGS